MNSDDFIKTYLPRFYKQGELRAERGRKEYGDRSFQTSVIDGINEIQEELVDTSVWAAIQWAKLEKLKEVVPDK